MKYLLGVVVLLLVLVSGCIESGPTPDNGGGTQTQIPQIILDQKIVDWDTHQSQDDTRIMINPANEHIICPSITIKLIDWRLSSEEEAQLIAESFIKNSEDKLDVLFNDLKLEETILNIPPVDADVEDYHKPTAAIKYKQYYNGIPVFESGFSVHINAYGTIWNVGNKLAKGITAPTTPTITSDGSIQIAKEKYNQVEFELDKEPELFIFGNKLVWRLNIFQPVFKEVIIDSQNGEIVLERTNIRS